MEALVLLSGGIDSAACVAFYRRLGNDVAAVFVDYGQPVREQEERSAGCHRCTLSGPDSYRSLYWSADKLRRRDWRQERSSCVRRPTSGLADAT